MRRWAPRFVCFSARDRPSIPSPELVVGSISSISQLVALVAATLGGGAALGLGARTRRGSGKSSRALWWTALGATALAVLFGGLDVYQFLQHRSERQERLAATLIRPSRDPEARILDPTLKEISYKDQVKDPHGITTDQVAELLAAAARGERPDLVFLDIRERAETEMSGMPQTTPIRFPDLDGAGIDLKGKTAILFCHNGNRSHETCEALAAKGIDCRFMVGGMEKWLVEGHALTGTKARKLSELRAVPPYRGQGVLLDTAEVHRLVQDEGAIFVDVRYPGEFADKHLPGAINLTIRRTPAEELKARIAALPKRPIIAPCYDRRSCFFGEILGLELDRAGRDFRGRYTVPWEYFVPSAPPPHIQKWMQDSEKGLWGRTGEALAGVVTWIADRAGFLAAIFGLALLSRLLVLPFSLKAERDQIRSRAMEGELEALKARLGDDPQRLARARRALYRRNGLTPGRNLVALFFLPILTLAVTAIGIAASHASWHFLWMRDLAARDPYYVLPVLFGVLVALYMESSLVRAPWHRLLVWLVGAPLLTGLAVLLGAAGQLYVLASAALLLLQRAVVVGMPARALAFLRGLRPDDGVVPLAEPDRLVGCGNKALRLGQLRAKGVAVPDGVVLTGRFLAEFAAAAPDWRRRQLDRIWRRLGAERVAVRSSAGAEDGAEHSFAGVFESVLHVSRAALEPAIEKVLASFATERAASYGIQGAGGNILVQRMVDAEYAGVLFTRDPSAGGLVMVEMVRGTAEGLVSGTVAPETFRFGRISGRPVSETQPQIDVAPLLAIGRQAEAIFGGPQDIEWTYRNGRFLIVQSRDVTRLLQDSNEQAAIERERARVLDRLAGAAPDETVLEQNELAEMLPRPTALSLSLMQALWASGGSVDLACRYLGLTYRVEEDAPDYLVTVFGRLYVDKRQEHARAPRLGALAVRQLNRTAERIERDFRDRFLPEFRHRMMLLEAVDFGRLPAADLFDMLDQVRVDYVTGTYATVDVINIAAAYYLEAAKKSLAEKGLDPAVALAYMPVTEPSRALAVAAEFEGDARRDLLLQNYGHRAPLDYELSQPRYRDAPESIESLCAVGVPLHGPEANAEMALLRAGEKTIVIVDRARRFQALKEDAKHETLRQLAVLRRIVVAIDQRLGLGGLAFHLTFDELASLRGEDAALLREVAGRRAEEHARFAEVPPLPPALSVGELETASSGGDAKLLNEGTVRGTRVSGSHAVEGRARVISPADAEAGKPISDLRDGDIIVAPMIHPAWLSHFRQAGGLVCEIGGWLSHTAIVAREYDLPMIVGARGLLGIPDGARLRLGLDGAVEILGADQAVAALSVAAE